MFTKIKKLKVCTFIFYIIYIYIYMKILKKYTTTKYIVNMM